MNTGALDMVARLNLYYAKEARKLRGFIRSLEANDRDRIEGGCLSEQITRRKK
jgi:hypothetical protein